MVALRWIPRTGVNERIELEKEHANVIAWLALIARLVPVIWESTCNERFGKPGDELEGNHYVSV